MAEPYDPAILTYGQLTDLASRIKDGEIAHGIGFPGERGNYLDTEGLTTGDLYRDDKTGELYRCAGPSEYNMGMTWVNLETGVSTDEELGYIYYYEFTNVLEPGMEDNCTVHVVDENKLINYVFENSRMGGSTAAFFGEPEYDPETGEPTGQILWHFEGGGMWDEPGMTANELEDAAGVFPEVTDPELGWASFDFEISYEVGENPNELYATINSPEALKSLAIHDRTGGLFWGAQFDPEQLGRPTYGGYIPRELVTQVIVGNRVDTFSVDGALMGCTGLTNVQFNCRRITGSSILAIGAITPKSNTDGLFGQVEEICGDNFGHNLGFAAPGTINFSNLRRVDEGDFLSGLNSGSNPVELLVPLLTEVGNGFMQGSNFLPKNSLTFPVLTTVGDSFLKNATLRGAELQCPSLVAAGHHFLDTAYQISAGSNKDGLVFPVLASVGDHAFQGYSYASLYLPALERAGHYFCYNADSLTTLRVHDLHFMRLGETNSKYTLGHTSSSASAYVNGTTIYYDLDWNQPVSYYLPDQTTQSPYRKMIDGGQWGGSGSSVNVVQTTGTSTTAVMSQNAATSMVYADPSMRTRVQIGANTYMGGSANNAVVIGEYATSNANNSVCLGAGARATQKGQMDISTVAADITGGYNNSQYRLLTGLYDGQSAHDATTKGQLDSIAIQNAGAPTTATVGTVGQLLEDTTNGKLYQCTAIDTTDPQNPSYTWTEVGGGSGPTVVQTTGTSTTAVMSQNAVTDLIGNVASALNIINNGNGGNS